MQSLLLLLLLSPFLVFAQDTNTTSPSNSSSPSPTTVAPIRLTVVTTTLTSTAVTIGSGRVESTLTFITTMVTTQPVQPSASGNNTNGSSTTISRTTASNLPTAPANVNGGGQGGAPVPGAKSPTNAFGPPDSYIAAAAALTQNSLLVAMLASMVGGALLIL